MSSKSKGFANNNNNQAKDAQQALKLIHQGKLKEAEFIYRKLIQEGVRDEIIFSNLAAICGTQGKKQEMVELLKKALSIKPNYPEALSNLGSALKQQGDLEGAIASYR
ncbi:MAG: tetratricopeptide repeat protein, partial [Aphanocapsa feldmannii 277cV]